MKTAGIVFFYLCIAINNSWAAEPPADANKVWPQWRGPNSNGVTENCDPPVEWSESKNIRWKVEIPGRGSSSPIVWDNRVFVTTAIPVDGGSRAPSSGGSGGRGPRSIEASSAYQFVIFAINRQDGKILWGKTVREEIPHEGTHPTGTWASSSAVTDGEHVYAYFGSRGLYCLDLDGNLKWERDFGDMRKKRSFGEGSSPVLHDDKIVVLWDHEGPSSLFVLEKSTGKKV